LWQRAKKKEWEEKKKKISNSKEKVPILPIKAQNIPQKKKKNKHPPL